jgi:DNA-binding SARP family transcriptional activator
MFEPGSGNPVPFDLGFDGGELLPGWGDPWLVADRERLWQLHLHLLEVMADQLATEERYCAALEFALAAVSADELRESAYRTLIRIHLAEGNVVEARRAYQRCTRLLAAELGVLPSPVTAALVPRLWSSHESPIHLAANIERCHAVPKAGP